MRRRTEADSLALTAIVSAGAMIAFQVGAKATRETLFLQNFPVTALPTMLVAASILSIAAVLAFSRAISRRGPLRVIPAAFATSAFLLVLEWMCFGLLPKVVAIMFYLHLSVFGSILISGFWSVVAELFDPRSAREKIGRIAAGGTLGGLLGGVIAERVAVLFSVSSMLPLLAVLQLACAILNSRLSFPVADARPRMTASTTTLGTGLRVLRDIPYIGQLAILVLVGTVAENLLDYVLKTHASTAFQGPQLMRFFAVFYTGVGLFTFLVQASLSRYSLQQFGLVTAMSSLPFVVATGGLGALVWPGIVSLGIVRGGQSVLRGSLFRSGYELLYAPVSRDEKRAAKTIVDVGFDRLGDAVGGGLIRLVLAFGLAASLNSKVLIALSVSLAVVSLVLTRRLGQGYVSALEKSLLSRAAELDLVDVTERSTRATMLRTLGAVDLSSLQEAQDTPRVRRPLVDEAVNPMGDRFTRLRSSDPVVVRSALSEESLDALLIAPTIRLLARDDVSEEAARALRSTVDDSVGQLTDALLNPDEDFAVRRRIPRVLAYSTSIRAIEGLMRGLADPRFEVRFSCGRGLSRICMNQPTLSPAASSVYDAAMRETAIAGRLTEVPRVIDRYEDPVALWNSTDIRLEHIFRLLSLSLPTEPLHVAFRALHTRDAYLRGTALEYLESILPGGIRENLWKFLEGPARSPEGLRPAAHVLEELMRSRERIELAATGAMR